MPDIYIAIAYSIKHDASPKKVICKVTVGLPVGNPSQSYALDSLLYDHVTEFLGEPLTPHWGVYDSTRDALRRYVTLELECDYSIDDYDTVFLKKPSLTNLISELVQLQWVIQRNIALENALPSKKEITLSIDEQGKIDLDRL